MRTRRKRIRRMGEGRGCRRKDDGEKSRGGGKNEDYEGTEEKTF